MIPALKITGNHPAGLWLAHCLKLRGWEIHCEPEAPPVGIQPGAYHHALADSFGRESLSFPPEWCFSRLAGIQLETDTGTELCNWPVSLLDLTAIWQDLQPGTPHSTLATPPLKLQLGFNDCTGCAPGSLLATAEAPVPSGFLIQQNGGWSVRLSAHQALHLLPRTCPDQPLLRLCQCLPQLQQPDSQTLVWSCPFPSLLPEAMLAQSMYWLVLQEVLTGLSQGSMQPEGLYRQWQACWQKVHQGLIAMAKRQKFLPIPR